MYLHKPDIEEFQILVNEVKTMKFEPNKMHFVSLNDKTISVYKTAENLLVFINYSFYGIVYSESGEIQAEFDSEFNPWDDWYVVENGRINENWYVIDDGNALASALMP